MGGGSGPPGHSGEPRPGTAGFLGHTGADSFSGSNAGSNTGASQQDEGSSGRGSGGDTGLHPAPEPARLPVPPDGGMRPGETAANGAGAVHLISVRV